LANVPGTIICSRPLTPSDIANGNHWRGSGRLRNDKLIEKTGGPGRTRTSNQTVMSEPWYREKREKSDYFDID
jgi:hypothetical protein